MLKPPSPPYTMQSLIEVMRALRDKDHGCPWDLEQTYNTIIPYTLEEAYEVADAIAKKDFDNLKEELGDLLLQSVYHAQMAAEENHFTIDDVISNVTEKMITRHPHVFSDASASSAEDVNAIWDSRKDKEKASEQSLMDGVPAAFPALLRAHKLQKKAAKIGFEWDDISGALDKLQEEIAELQEAIASKDQAHIQEELGDVFFVMVNYARMSGFNAEETLRLANNKFEARFREMEKILGQKGINIKECDLETKETAWQEAKLKEKQEKAA